MTASTEDGDTQRCHHTTRCWPFSAPAVCLEPARPMPPRKRNWKRFMTRRTSIQRTPRRCMSDPRPFQAAPADHPTRLQRDVLEHLWRQFPQHCVILGDPQTRRVVDLAAERAAVHGFYSTAEVSSWVTLMVYFGSYFDEDPQVSMGRQRSSANRPERRARMRWKRLYAKSGDVLTGNRRRGRRVLPKGIGLGARAVFRDNLRGRRIRFRRSAVASQSIWPQV